MDEGNLHPCRTRSIEPVFNKFLVLEMADERKIGNDIVAVVLLTFIVFLVASLATYDTADPVADNNALLSAIYQPDVLVYPQHEASTNACGAIGAWMADMLIHVFGIGAYYFVIGLVALEVKLFQQRPVRAPWFKTIGWVLSLIGVTALGALLVPNWIVSPLIGSGGYLGALSAGLLQLNLGSVGGLMVALSGTLIGLMMWTEYVVIRAGRVMFTPAAVAAASLLPFGLLYGFMQRVNDVEEEEEYEEDEYEDEEELDQSNRTIKIRRGSDSEELEEEEDEYEEEEEPESSGMVIKSGKGGKEAEETEEVEEEEEAEEEETEVAATAATITKKPHFAIKKPAKPKPKPATEREQVISQLNKAAMAESIDDYELPSLDLLLEGDDVPFEDQKRDALKKARILENTCKEFGYNVNVVEVETGPVISQYEIQLEAGLRLQKVTALADDLAIALRVPSVRIVAPIPGKNTVGIEVPNENRQVVRLREVMEQCESKIGRMNIPLFLGNDAVGAPMLVDLAKMPHLLIAGRTGTGKSVCLNAIISSILMTRRPDEVRMLMIDPKMVELSGYGRLPHLMHPVVTDMKKAEAILAWAVDKMEDRYRLLAKAGVRHINSYNQLGEEELLERLKPESEEEEREIPSNLPFIVIVADEMADLMMTAGKEVEQHIIRLAQKSRAVGIHLILATQKPTVDVITGLIKSNLPARLAFQVASKRDSRVVLDSMGAEKLLGCGDMLFLWPGTSTLLRGQGTFLSDDEIETITEAVSTGEQNFVHELVNIKVEQGEDDGDANEKIKKRDEVYSQAVDVVVNEQRGSVSLLQRMLGIGYGRAARLVDYMEEDGFVGPYNGSKSREVLLTAERWQAIQAGTDGESAEPEDIDDLEGTDFYGEDEEQESTVSLPISTVENLRSTSLSANQAAEVAEDEELEEDEEYLDDEAYEDEEEEYEDDEDEEYEEEEDGDPSAYDEEDYEEVEDDEEYEYEDDEEEEYEEED